jgi:hypothetical protein
MGVEENPLISLKEAGRLLGMDLFAVLRIANKKKGPRLQTFRVSQKRRRTTVAAVEAYLRELNPPAAELLSEGRARLIASPARARTAAQIDRELERRGYGRGRKRKMRGVSQVGGGGRHVPLLQSGSPDVRSHNGGERREGTDEKQMPIAGVSPEGEDARCMQALLRLSSGLSERPRQHLDVGASGVGGPSSSVSRQEKQQEPGD